MAIPTYWAKDIWLAAIAQITGKKPDAIKPTDSWDKYMSKPQLGAAYDLTNNGLHSHGYRSSWTLVGLANTSIINDQIALLASSTDKVNPPDPLHLALAGRITRKRK
jgi:hypothetical protein